MRLSILFIPYLILAAEPPKTVVDRVEFSTDFPADKLHKQLQNLRARTLVPGWKIRPQYNEQAAAADVHRLQSYLIARGYLDAKIEQGEAHISDGKAVVRMKVNTGMLHKVPANWSRDLCRCLLEQRRAAERLGSLDFAASLDAATRELTTEAGEPYHVGRIEFRGHRKLKDATLRKSILLDEGDLFDSALLRKSLARLTASGLVEPMKEDSVRLRIRAAERTADVVIHVTEQKGNRWQISGPMGPVSFAGPLQASISSRLPSWGRGIFDLSTYALSAGVMSTVGVPAWGMKGALLPFVALSRPYSAADGWKSGWFVSPNYGWRLSAQSYASEQATARLMPFVTGQRAQEPPLAVEVRRANGNAYLNCEQSKPRLAALRARLPLIVQLASAMASF